MNKRMISRTAILAAAVLSAPAALASEEGIIKYRQGVMKAQGGHMGAMGQVVQGKADYAGNMAAHARGLHDMAKLVADLFPEGTDFGETNALPEIWDNMGKFKDAAGETVKAAAALEKAIATGDRGKIGDAYKGVGKTCKGCHEDFRKKDE